MALSEHELRQLAQLEADLAQDDPELADVMSGVGHRKIHRRRAALAGLGFLVGVAALLGGLQINPIISIVGFIIMLVSAVIAVGSWQFVSEEQMIPDSTDEPSASFMDRMNERWEKRQEGP